MKTTHIILGLITAAFVFGAYFLGLFHGQGRRIKIGELICGVFRTPSVFGSVTRKGICWAVALPAAWLLIYYSFIAHVWFSLGRWPKFGEALDNELLSVHREIIAQFGGALLGSVYISMGVLLVCLFLPRWRHVATYALCYGSALLFAALAMFWLAPHPFLNWYFD